jgi:mRNA interferase RelE/StbE
LFEDLPGLSSIEPAGNIEKMKRYKNYYKVRFGEYRIGILINNSAVELKRVLNGKEIYKFFP